MKKNDAQNPSLNKRCKYIIIILSLAALASAAANIWTFFFHVPLSRVAAKMSEQYPLIDFSRNFIKQENFFSTVEPLRKKLKQMTADYEKEGHRIGVYYEFLNTGANIAINEKERFWPASLSKMPTVIAAMKKTEKGEWKLTNELVLLSEDKDERFGELYKEPVGTRFTIEELIKKTLIDSDNTSHRILVRNLSSNDYTDIFEAFGVEELFNENYDIAPKEYSRVFRALYSASYLSRENSQKILEWLSRTKFNEYFGAGIPPEVPFSHKIGEMFDEGIFLDSGIAYVPNRPYLVVVMVKLGGGYGAEKAKEIMKTMSKEMYDYAANH